MSIPDFPFNHEKDSASEQPTLVEEINKLKAKIIVSNIIIELKQEISQLTEILKLCQTTVSNFKNILVVWKKNAIKYHIFNILSIAAGVCIGTTGFLLILAFLTR